MRPCASPECPATRRSSSATYASVSPGGAKPPTSRAAAAGSAWVTVPSARFPPSTPPKRAAAAATPTAASTTEAFFLIASSPVRKGPATARQAPSACRPTDRPWGSGEPPRSRRTASRHRGSRRGTSGRSVDAVAEQVVRAPVRQPEQPVQEGAVALREGAQVDVDDVVLEPAAVRDTRRGRRSGRRAGRPRPRPPSARCRCSGGGGRPSSCPV